MNKRWAIALATLALASGVAGAMAGAGDAQTPPVRGLDHGLRGDRADAGPRPRAQRADAEPVRLDRRAELARLRVQGDDRVGAVAHRARISA